MASPPITGSSIPPSAVRPSMSAAEKIAYYESVITQCRQQFYKQTLGNHVLKKRVRSTWKELKKLRQSTREICRRSSDARQQLFKLTSEKIAQLSEELRALQCDKIDTVGTALSNEAQLSARLDMLKISSSEELRQAATTSRHLQELWDKVREQNTALKSRVAARNHELDHIEGLRNSCKELKEKLLSENVHQCYEECYKEFTSVVRDLATEMDDKDKTLLELYTAKQLSINTHRAVTYPLRKEKALYEHSQEKLDCKLKEARATLARLQGEIRELKGEERRCMTLGQAMSRLTKECQAKNATLGSLREQIEVSERKEGKECQQNHHRKEKTGKDKRLHRETENLKDMRRTLRSYQLVVAYCGTSSYRIRPEH
ncbi:PREDICTED: centrosome-associated protein CEP250-like [Branchiostoma belcheri]|uniref:Centrosome-associated protein CEP250-like n=1 Tax=Branchiostoma belcheri TaxID=7741 RepID=A0A6P4XTZ4_BRABE|nr:PREDICTED: centrosome-associated protein CEP250-like [Branchiostoma belcheri]